MKRIAVFPGSFDPITRGHESIVRRSLPLFDEIIIAIGENSDKQGMFPASLRVQWIQEVFHDCPSVTVKKYSGLTVDFCKKSKAAYILRGLRTSADFEFERTIGQMNRAMSPDIETIFLLSEPEFNALSSSVVRDIHRHGGDVSSFIPGNIKLPATK